MPSSEEKKGQKMPNMTNLESTDIRGSASFAKKPRKYGLFAKLSLSVVGAREVDYNPHIFLTRVDQHIQEINRHFGGTLNLYGPIVSAENQEQKCTHTFKEMLLQTDKSHFILSMSKEVESHEARSHWTLTKKRYGNIKTILSIWHFKCKRFPYRRLIKYKARICAHEGMQQWGVN